MPPYIVIDYEGFYDQKTYSLRKMTPVEYILDPRFELIGAGVCEGDTGLPFWLDGHELQDYLQGNSGVPLVSHNALFDMCVTLWKLRVNPPLMIDTMGMARATIQGYIRGVSLASVGRYLGIGHKGDAVLKASGYTGAMLRQSPMWSDYVAYAKNDAAMCRDIFKALRPSFPRAEYEIMDMVIRMATHPQALLNEALLAEHAQSIAANKDALLHSAGLSSRDALMSNDKFAAALEAYGVDPPRKISLTTKKETWAFAKTDQGMAELEEHDNPAVQALVAARLGHKSTIEETRTERFQSIARLDWQGVCRPRSMPMPLKYSGPHTHRLSGDWKLNVQNLGRGSKLREAVEAPPGYKIVSVDASQIEARLNAVVSGQDDLVADFALGKDVYSTFAGEEVYHMPVDKKNNPKERFIGKQCILGLGYNMGPPKFKTKVRSDSRLQLGMDIDMSLPEATAIVQAYRRRYNKIAGAWRFLQSMLPRLAHEDSRVMFGPMMFRHRCVEGPNGLFLHYPELNQVVKDGNTRWIYTFNGAPKDLYGGKILENFCQYLARVANFEAAVRLRRLFPQFWPAIQVHDELVYVIPDPAVAEFKEAAIVEMSRSPWWAPNAPLAAEAGVGQSYGNAK